MRRRRRGEEEEEEEEKGVAQMVATLIMLTIEYL